MQKPFVNSRMSLKSELCEASCQLPACLSFSLRSADVPGLNIMFNIGVVNPDIRSNDNDDDNYDIFR